MSKEINLTRGKSTLVDEEDYDFLMQWKWHYSSSGYAIRSVQKSWCKESKKQSNKKIYMHRILNNTPDNLITDHINGDTLDNRKINLRNCTISQNGMNTRRQVNSKYSIYKGVYFSIGKKTNKPWMALISKDRKRYYIGHYISEKEAALAWNKKAKELHGEFAYQNEVLNDING